MHPRWGSGSLHRLRISSYNELFGLGTIPLMDVLLSNNGKVIRVKAGLDTGATGVIIPRSIAGHLGLRNFGREQVKVVGGAVVEGYRTIVGSIEFAGSETCTLKNHPAIITDLNVPGQDILIGEDYFKKVGLTISYAKGGTPIVVCTDPDLRWLNDPFSTPNAFLLIAGGLFLTGFLVSLTR